jgi:DNA repair exonuclease SbcCD ATPase subunit
LQLLREYPAPASISWLEAVAGAPAIADTNVSLARVSDRLVRDLLDGEAMIQQIRLNKEESSQLIEMLQRDLADRERKLESLSKKAESTSLQALQKQLAERDKKIEELSTQLEALKRIDQEMRDKVRPIRPPSTVAPLPPLDPTP